MNILQLLLVLMFIINYKSIKLSIQELSIDLIKIILLPIKLIILIKWKLKKKLLNQ